jgi:hypothetical protein
MLLGGLGPGPLTPAHVIALQRSAGNAAVTRYLQRAAAATTPPPAETTPGAGEASGVPSPEDVAAMREDVDFIVAKLGEELLTASEEAQIVARLNRWDRLDEQHIAGSAQGTPYVDKILLLLKTRSFPRATLSSMWQDQYVNAFDELWRELEDDRLISFSAIVARSQGQKAAGPASGPAENAWATIGKKEAMGMLGLVKGLVMGATGLVDAGAGGITAVLKAVQQIPGVKEAGFEVADAPKVAEWFGEQYDYMGRQGFGEEWDTDSASAVGTKGGQLVWGLVMIGAGNQLSAGAAGTAAPSAIFPTLEAAKRVQTALAVINVLGSVQGVSEAATGIASVIARLQKQDKLTVANLVGDREFLRNVVALAAAIYGAISGAPGGGGDTTEAERWAAARVGALLEILGGSDHLAEIIETYFSDDPPEVKNARYLKALGEFSIVLYRAVAQLAGAHDAGAPEAGEKKADPATEGGQKTTDPATEGGPKLPPADASAGGGSGGGGEGGGGASGGGGPEELFDPKDSWIGPEEGPDVHPSRQDNADELFDPPDSYIGDHDVIADEVAAEGRARQKAGKNEDRAVARDLARERLTREIDSGYWSPQTAQLVDDIGLDNVVALADGKIGWKEAGAQVHHKTMLAEAPELGRTEENLEPLGDRAHRYGAHGNDYRTKRGGLAANPDFDENLGFSGDRRRGVPSLDDDLEGHLDSQSVRDFDEQLDKAHETIDQRKRNKR